MSSAAGAAYSEDPSGEQSALVRIEIEGGQPQRLARRGPIRRAEGLEPAVLEQLRDRVVEAEGELGEPAQLRWQCSSAGQLSVSAIGPIAAPLPWGRTPIPAHPRDQWSRANAGEVFPVVMTPLTWSLTLDALERGFRAPWSGLAQGRRFVALFEGYIYFNVGLILELLGDRLGLRTSDFLLAVGGPEAQQAAADRIDYRRLLLSAPFLLRRGLQQRSLPRRWREARREAQRRRDELRQLDAEASSDQQLLRALTASGFYSAQFVEFLLHCQASVFGQVQFLLWLSESWIGDRGIALRLLQGLPGVLTAESNLDLWRLAERAGGDERAAALVGATPPAQLLEALAADPQSAWLAEALHEFLARHGHRTATELELSQPRWAEQPEPILSTFRDYVQHPQQSSPAQLQARQTASREAAERDAERALTANWLDRALPLRWLIYRSQMREAQSLQPLRENPKYVLLQLSLEQRRLYLLLGRRWRERGALADAEDIFWLLDDEIAALARRLDDPAAAGRMRSRVRRRRQQHELWTAQPAPPIRDRNGAPLRSAAPPPTEAEAPLRGIAASTGRARARARVAVSPEQGRTLVAGEILVARFTDPGWTPIFPLAAAVVTEIGGMLSHGAIVAREYGIPAVVNVADATSRIATGDLIEVNGASGEVRVLEAEAD